MLNLCLRYRIPNINIQTSFSDSYKSTKYPFVISKRGVSNCSDMTPDNLKVFKSIGELRNCLFKRNLLEGRIVVFKDNYRTYLNTIKLLKLLGIKGIKNKTYFDEANAFCVRLGLFRELDYFGCRCVVSMTNGIQFKAREFLDELKRCLRDEW